MELGIILAVRTKDVSVETFEYELEELKNLAYSCGIDIVDTVTQNLEEVNNQTYIGKR